MGLSELELDCGICEHDITREFKPFMKINTIVPIYLEHYSLTEIDFADNLKMFSTKTRIATRASEITSLFKKRNFHILPFQLLTVIF